MSSHRTRLAWMLLVSLMLHVLLLIAFGGQIMGREGPFRIPGILIVQLVNLGARGAEAKITPDAEAPLQPHTEDETEKLEDQPSLDRERREGKEQHEESAGEDPFETGAKEKEGITEDDEPEIEHPSPGIDEPFEPAPRPGDAEIEDDPGIEPARRAGGEDPAYPEQAERRGIEGTVVVKFQVLADGDVGDIFVEKSSGFPVLDEAAMQAVKSWTFYPATKDGEPVASTQTRTFQFGLSAP